MNDFKIATVGPYRHRPAPIGAKNGHLPPAETFEHLRRGMPEPIAPHADHRRRRAQGVQQLLGGAPGRSMVPHLEHLHLLEVGGQDGFSRGAGISGEEGIEGPVAEV